MSVGTLNETPRGERLHIAICGRRNAGKSSLINALTGQNIAIVSPVPGTTTDPVYKSMEILPLGPVVLIDTAGLDDLGELGELRIKKTMEVLPKADLLILVVDPGQDTANVGVGAYESALIGKAAEQGLPVIGVLHKADMHPGLAPEELSRRLGGVRVVPVSSLSGQGVAELKKEIIQAVPAEWTDRSILGDLLEPGDTVVLVTPIDAAAPKGRLILPQVQTIRDVLDHDACAVVVKESGLQQALRNLAGKPKLVVTDAQAFAKVDADTPADIPLTAFSILFARHKGDLATLVSGVRAVDRLKPGDRVLIAEACTHHRVSDDIGTVKIPRWLCRRVGGDLDFQWHSGGSGLPEDLSQYQLIVHCGGCMINRKQMLHRIAQAEVAGVPIVNYGVLIAYLNGILPRALTPFRDETMQFGAVGDAHPGEL